MTMLKLMYLNEFVFRYVLLFCFVVCLFLFVVLLHVFMSCFLICVVFRCVVRDFVISCSVLGKYILGWDLCLSTGTKATVIGYNLKLTSQTDRKIFIIEAPIRKDSVMTSWPGNA